MKTSNGYKTNVSVFEIKMGNVIYKAWLTLTRSSKKLFKVKKQSKAFLIWNR